MATAKKAAKAAETTPKLIASFEEACEKLSMAPIVPINPIVTNMDKGLIKSLEAHYKLIIIAQALNDGWVPNWDDNSEWKYYPWFDMEKATTSGSGFAFLACAYAYTGSRVGSRLAYKSSELAEYAGKTFLDLYRDYFVIPPAE